MPEKPYETPIKGRPTPEILDELLIDTIECNNALYIPLHVGAPHPDTVNYPGHKLVKEEATPEYGVYKRYYSNGFVNQDSYNYDTNYTAESNSHPVFVRRYLELRTTYEPLTKESILDGVWLVRVTNGGTGYGETTTATITGGGGSGATVGVFVDSLGVIQYIYVTNEGSGYTSTPNVNISGAGVGATAVAIIHQDNEIVASVVMTNIGSGYTDSPDVSFSGGGGTGATAVAQIDSSGHVRTVTVMSFGSGFTSAPGVVFTGGGGTGAAADATLETARFVLVKEDARELPADDPRASLYLLVTRVYETLPGPVLTTHDFEAFIDNYVRVEKRLVLASTVPGDMYYVDRVPGEITEYQPLTKYRSIQIVSRINDAIAWENGGADEIYYGYVKYTFPNELPVTELQWLIVWASSGDSLTLDADIPFNVVEGYSGPCPARFTRRYTFDPEDAAFVAALPTPLVINPQAHKVYTYFFFAGGNISARVITIPFPSTLHPEITLTTGGIGTPPSGSLTLQQTIPATTPTTIPFDTWIVVSVTPVRWRFGLWAVDITEVQRPA